MFINYADKEKWFSRRSVLKDFEEMQAIVECCGSDKSTLSSVAHSSPAALEVWPVLRMGFQPFLHKWNGFKKELDAFPEIIIYINHYNQVSPMMNVAQARGYVSLWVKYIPGTALLQLICLNTPERHNSRFPERMQKSDIWIEMIPRFK